MNWTSGPAKGSSPESVILGCSRSNSPLRAAGPVRVGWSMEKTSVMPGPIRWGSPCDSRELWNRMGWLWSMRWKTGQPTPWIVSRSTPASRRPRPPLSFPIGRSFPPASREGPPPPITWSCMTGCFSGRVASHLPSRHPLWQRPSCICRSCVPGNRR